MMLIERSNARLPGHFAPVLTILLLRGSLASLTPLMSNSRTWRLSCGRAMILWLAETLILKDQIELNLNLVQILLILLSKLSYVLLYNCSLDFDSTACHFLNGLQKYLSTNSLWHI